MKLLTLDHLAQLKGNGVRNRALIDAGETPLDLRPVVKLFTPDAAATWLLSEIDPEDSDIAYGLCDLGLGFVEFGPVRLTEIRTVRGRLGLPVERDEHFTPSMTIREYQKKALALDYPRIIA